MAKQKGTLWIDVTMLINWSGHLTGIQRVEYNLAKRFAEHDDVKFCVFRKETRNLTEFDFKHIAYKIEQLKHQKHAPAAAAEPEIDATSIGQLTKRILRKAKRIAAPMLSASSKTYLKRQYHRLRNASHRQQAEAEAPIDIKQHDTLLILSGDWSDDIFASMVADMRAETGFKVVQIVYDMLPAFFPAFFVPGMPDQFSTYMEKMFAHCDGILAISESTKRDVERFMKQRKQAAVPVQVFRLGDDFVKQEAVKPDLAVKKGNFLLVVCTVEARKNHTLLYYAAREAQLRGEEFPTVVLVGKRGWLSSDFQYLVDNDPILSQKFLFTNCTDAELAWLYQNCSFTVFPSFYEGWGLPVAESLFYGKYCLSSGTSSMPEIAGGLIEYFSPNDPAELLQKILHYTKSPDKLKAKESKIAQAYKPTSWDEAFTQAHDFVEEIRG